jgi:hypothetical protein
MDSAIASWPESRNDTPSPGNILNPSSQPVAEASRQAMSSVAPRVPRSTPLTNGWLTSARLAS